MKRMLALMMALLLTAALAVPAMAANNFTKSPTVQPLPIVVDPQIPPQVVDAGGKPVVIIGNEDKPIAVVPETDGSDGKYEITGDSLVDPTTGKKCQVTMWVTSYGDKARLLDIDEDTNPDTSVIAKAEVDAKDRIEAARADIDTFDSNFTEWKEIWEEDAPQLAAQAQNRQLAVVAVFDVSIWCDTHTHAELSNDVIHHIHWISLKIDKEQVGNFGALMHYNKNYEWKYVPSIIDYENSIITFQIDCADLSPFAIAAYSEGGSHHGDGGGSETGEPTSPQTGEIGNGGYWMSCGMFFAVAGVTALYRQKKEKRYAR